MKENFPASRKDIKHTENDLTPHVFRLVVILSKEKNVWINDVFRGKNIPLLLRSS